MGTLKDLASEWIKVGTMQIVSRFLSGDSLNDPEWQKKAMHTLMGFAVYYLFTRQIAPTSQVSQRFRPVADDTIKVGTMLVISRLLNGLPLTDSTWQRASLATLLGFASYQLIIRPQVPTQEWTDYKPLLGAVNDWFKYGTMLVVSHLLTGGSIFDPKWAAASVATLVGYTIFHMVTSHLLRIFDHLKISAKTSPSVTPAAPTPASAPAASVIAPAPAPPAASITITPPEPLPANA